MKKSYLILASSAMILAGCANEEYLGAGENPENHQSNTGEIVFSSRGSMLTRADYYGRDAATLLNSKFVVEGTKGQSATPDYKEVFDNYLVEWGENTAGNTASNTHDWEYVGKSSSWGGHNNTIAGQTIKYWDYSTDQYDFLAYSLGSSTGVTASKITFKTTAPAETPLTTSAYTLTGTAAELGKCYISDLVTVEKANYGNVVQLKFRNFDAKIRLAMYETVPGYAVKEVIFYTDATASTGAGTNKVATLYGAANSIVTSGTYKVYVPTPSKTGETSSDKNKVHVALNGAATATDSKVQMGELTSQYVTAENNLNTNSYLGRTSNTATYAKDATNSDDKFYVQVLPNEKGTVLNLHVDYTLVSIDGSGEEIKVVGATAQIPATYTAWKSNYAYTYLFKISDSSNGYTSGTEGTNPAGLYPITFDAVVINSVDDNIQETITTIGTLATTTYAKGVNPTENDEYKAGSNIYVTVMDNGSAVALDGSKDKLYKITDAETTPGDLLLSEEDVYNVLVNGTGTPLALAGKKLTDVTVDHVDNIAASDATDGNETVLAATSLKYSSAVKGYYAFVYTKTAAVKTTYKAATGTAPVAATTYYVKGNFKPVTITEFEGGTTYYTYNTTTRVYSKVTGSYVAGTKYYVFEEGSLYHAVADMNQAKFDSYMADGKLYVVDQAGSRGEYAIKVIKVVE